MCHAIRDHAGQTGIKAGIKPAGGISLAADALAYAGIVNGVLGSEWLSPSLFRIGASRLANNLLSEISRIEGWGTDEVAYF